MKKTPKTLKMIPKMIPKFKDNFGSPNSLKYEKLLNICDRKKNRFIKAPMFESRSLS